MQHLHRLKKVKKMTRSELIARLGQTLKPQERTDITLDTGEVVCRNVGGVQMKKMDGSKGYVADAAALLFRNNGTFTWDVMDPLNGSGTFNNIYEYAAAEIYAPGGSLRSRMEASQDYVHEARTGFTSLSKYLDEVHGMTLFRTPSNVKGYKSKTDIITIIPDLIVRDNGDTAKMVQMSKDTQQIRGTVKSAFTRIGRQDGEVKARTVLNKIVDDIIDSSTLEPSLLDRP